jgi:hypothetical protein
MGALITKALFDSTREIIVCVCYTNHERDQFLLDLPAHGIPEEQLAADIVNGSAGHLIRTESVMCRRLTWQMHWLSHG